MWPGWSFFRRKTDDSHNVSLTENGASAGKENAAGARSQGNVAVLNNNNSSNYQSRGDGRSLDGVSSHNGSFSPLNGHATSPDSHSCLQSSFDDQPLHGSVGGRTINNGHMFQGTDSSSVRSPLTQSGGSHRPPGETRTSDSSSVNNNKSFSGVYGPLLSSPLVPKIRRALESNTGLRSPQTSILTRGKPVARSSSLNYGSVNPVKSTAGKVPWVRLKKRESVTLTDIVNGTTPQSPNTVKLAVSEPRQLPAAPSFKTTPLIVSTEHSRARVVDTQAVVSALREKRKRFGGGASQREDSFSEDSWINAAKRRRQDSSQSNASSVSIPSMPESLPDLMATPGVSLRHIENFKDQRPSAVPAMDAFVSRHQREFGLGGDLLGHVPPSPVYNQHQEEQGNTSTHNSKSVLRSIQSSLSSSLRTRTNLTALQNTGVALTRIRPVQDSRAVRRMSVSFDEPTADQSTPETQSKVSQPAAAVATPDRTTASQADASTLGDSALKKTPALSVQRQKIAEGVVLKKPNLSSFTTTSTPTRPKQMLTTPVSQLVSASDIEHDRQKEYKRRVLDLLDEDDRPELSSAPSVSTTAAMTTTAAPISAISFGLPAITASSSAATSAAVSASLDSLNKLVQSAATTSGLSLTSAGSVGAVSASSNSLEQLLKSSEGKPPVSSTSSALNKEVSFGFIASTQPAQVGLSSTSTIAVSSSIGGFQFGVTSSSQGPTLSSQGPTLSSQKATHNTNAAANSGFDMNLSATPASLVASSAGNQHMNSVGLGSGVVPGSVSGSLQTANSGFNFSSLSGIGGALAGGRLAFSAAAATTASPAASDVNTTVAMPAACTSVSPAGCEQVTPTAGCEQVTPTAGCGQVTPTAGNSQVGQVTDSVFGSHMSQPAVPTAPSSFSSSKSTDQTSTQPATSGIMNPSFGLAANPLSAASSTNVPGFGTSNFATPSTGGGGLFSYGTTSTTASPAAGLHFSQGGVGNAQTGISSSLAPSTAGSSAMTSLAFNFGASSATTTSSQQPGVLSVGAASSSSQPAISGGFSGFGLSSQNNSGIAAAFSTGGLQQQRVFAPSSAPSSVTASQLFTSGHTSAFGGSVQSSISSQQPFGASTAAAGLSMFASSASTTSSASTGMFTFGQSSAPTNTTMNSGTFTFGQNSAPTSTAMNTSTFNFGQNSAPTSTTTNTGTFNFGQNSAPTSTTTNTGTFSFGQNSAPTSTTPNTSTFAFGQNSANSAFSKPFAFGTSSTQSGSGFGASSTQSGSGFGAAATASNNVLGSVVSVTPSTGTSTSMFGSSAPAFGSSSTTSSFGPTLQGTPATMFGSSVVTLPPAFGSTATTTTASSAFGQAAASTAVFGAINSRSSSVFGTAPASGGQAASAFAVPASSSNHLFTFGAGIGSQPAPTFASNTNVAFSATSTSGSSIFGAKPAAVAGNPGSVFGVPAQSSSSATTPAFGTSFGMSSTFGAQSTADKAVFGATVPAFGSSGVSVLGSTPQGSTLGGLSQNPAASLFGSVSQNPPPFGSQQSSAQAFGSQQSSAQAFGSQQSSAQAFGSQQSSAQTFGSQQSSSQVVGSGPFGGIGSGGAGGFASAKANPFGATGSRQANVNFAATASSSSSLFSSQQTQPGFNFAQPNSQATASNTGFNFGAQPNSQATANSTGFNFGAQPNSQATASNTGFNFGAQPNSQATASNTGFNFGAQPQARPALQPPSQGGFNFAAATTGSTPAFNFSATPNNPNPFSPQTPGVAPRSRAAARRATRRGGTRR